jgi:hypothetical protein
LHNRKEHNFIFSQKTKREKEVLQRNEKGENRTSSCDAEWMNDEEKNLNWL